MGEKIIIGPFNRGLRNDRTPFNIDNDSFPFLVNSFQWRGRIKRKRGTSPLGRLTIILPSFFVELTVTGSDSAVFNLFTVSGLGSPTASIVPGSVEVTISGGNAANAATYSDNGDTTFTTTGNGRAATSSINYANGGLTIGYTNLAVNAPSNINVSFSIFPGLPVMGLEDLNLTQTQFPGTIAFDPTYAYNVSTVFPYPIYNVNFYKNPIASVSLPGYVQKAVTTEFFWNGQNYQQFWSTNYQGAFWATNGINVPFSTSNVGMPFGLITNVTIITPGNGTTVPAVASITSAGNNLVVGDFVFVNEVGGITGINFQTGYVTTSGNPFQVTFPTAILAGAYTSGGMFQYLTSQPTGSVQDCLRWYDGDPTNGSGVTNPGTGFGWVNFCPPLSNSQLGISDLPPAQYYLVSGRIVFPFKDRLLVFGAVVQSSTGSPIYLQDTIIWSENGTPYYTCTWNNAGPVTGTNPNIAINIFSVLVPVNQTAFPSAWFEDVTGFGGFLQAGNAQPIITVSFNEDVLIVGFSNQETRLVYTGNDLLPFNLFAINSELGTASTFSIINLDKGILTRGNRGFILTSQTGAQRFDLEIPDQVFEINLQNNGNERFTAGRDFLNEWVFFTYNSNDNAYLFPNQTLFYNYRENTWAMFIESYTTYGAFRRTTGLTWNTLPADLTWDTWDSPWDSSDSTIFQQDVIAGNQQGFIVIRNNATDEAPSVFIQNIDGMTVTSANHNLNNGDYITISGVLGTIGANVNGKIFSVQNPTTNTFVINPNVATGSYLGGGVITRMYVPFIQTKEFPPSWGISRKTRIGVQQFLFTTTANGQVTLLVFLSQNNSSPYNEGSIVPDVSDLLNSALIYSTLVYTCPESTNLGLTPANINLQIPTSINQDQTWHRMNTSLIGDSVQLGFTLNDTQMRDPTFSNQFVEIELHGIIIDVNPSQVLV